MSLWIVELHEDERGLRWFWCEALNRFVLETKQITSYMLRESAEIAAFQIVCDRPDYIARIGVREVRESDDLYRYLAAFRGRLPKC